MNKFIFDLNEKKEDFNYEFLTKFETENENSFTEEEKDFFLRWVISRIKEFLPNEDNTYSCLCGEAADLACELFDSLGFFSRQVNLKGLLHQPLNVHAITIVNFCSDIYIIDPTFRQYLVSEYCVPGQVIPYSDGKVYHVPCYPGYFLSLTEEGRKFGQELLNKGFFKLTDDNLKIYCDSFVSYFNSVWQKPLDTDIRSGMEYRRDLFKLNYEKNGEINPKIKLTPSEILEQNKKLIKK